MEDMTFVVVSRKWQEPFIRLDITSVGIGISMTLEDFVQALSLESGVDLREHSERIVSEMKKETVKVI